MKNQVTNLITKIISILVIMLMIVNSSLMLVISVAADAVQKIIDEKKTNAIYELNIEKYVNYKIGDKQGTLVQTNLKTGIEYQEGQEYAPIQETNVTINTPKINDKYPENVEIITKSTKATNGDGNGKDVNYTYNKENGQLQIITENKADDKGNIYTENVAGARDEYQIDFYYDADCYNGENQKRVLSFTGKENLKVKNNENEAQISKDIKSDFEVAENKSGLISTNVTTSDIYNGFINANVKNGTANDTEYTEYMNIQVGYKEIADEMHVTLTNTLKNKNDKETETTDVVYKGLKLNKQNILDILGEDGNLQVLDNKENKLAEVNKDTNANDNGTIEVNYENEQNSIIVKTTKPVKIGDLKIENKKSLKASMTDLNNNKIISKSTVKCINRVQKEIEQTQENKETQEVIEEKYNFENTNEEQIKEAKTRIDINFNKTEWTNSAQNDTTITATLVTNSPEYNLFKNPVIEIQLPQEVEKVVLGETQLLYNDNLSIKKAEVIDRNNQKVIRIELNGTQNAYTTNSIVNGVNVVIPATIIVKKDIESTQTNAYYAYLNETATGIDYEQEGKNCKNIGVNITVPQQEENNEPQETQQEEQEVVSANLDAEITAKVGNDVIEDKGMVYQGEVITYTYKITNNTGKTVNGIKAVATVPDNTVYVTKDGSYIIKEGDNESGGRNPLFVENQDIKNLTKDIGKLENGKTQEFSFQVRVKNEGTFSTQLTISSENKENIVLNKTATAKSAPISVEVFSAEDVISSDTNNKVAFCVSVVNNSATETISNAKVKIQLADEWVFYDIKEMPPYTYDEKTKTIEFDTGEIVPKQDQGETKQTGEQSYYI